MVSSNEQANRTRVDGHPRQEWETGDVLGGWGSSRFRPKAWLILNLVTPLVVWESVHVVCALGF